MLEIQHDKTTGVGLLARQSDTVTSPTISNIGVVNTDVCCSISLADQTLTLGPVLIDIIDVSVRWIVALFVCEVMGHYREGSSYGEEIKHAEEVIGIVVILEHVAGHSGGGKAYKGKERG